MVFQILTLQTCKKLNYIAIVSVAVFTVVFSAEQYQDESVVQHNKYRRRYGAPPLVVSEELNEAAVKCSKYYAEIEKINHKCPYKKIANFSDVAGENLFAFLGGRGNHSKIGGAAGWSWWKEHKSYNHSNIKFSHFTQMIWKGTTHMGIGVHNKNGTKNWYVCALYYPFGNLVGSEKKNLNPRDESVTE